MGYRKIPTIHTIDDFEKDPGLVVRVKGLKFGKVRKLIRLMDDDTADQAVMDAIAAELLDGLVSWNLEDEHGRPVEMTPEGLDDQDFELVLDIVGKWLDAITGPDEDLGKDSPSGETFPGRPLTMEAL